MVIDNIKRVNRSFSPTDINISTVNKNRSAQITIEHKRQLQSNAISFGSKTFDKDDSFFNFCFNTINFKNITESFVKKNSKIFNTINSVNIIIVNDNVILIKKSMPRLVI